MKDKGFKIIKNAKEKSADVYIYEDIGDGWFGGLSAKQFSDEMKEIGDVDTMHVYINSCGGDVFEGVAIYSILRRNKANVIIEIDGLAASIASVIAMAGNEVRMAENAMLMIHDPWTMAVGNADDMRKQADDMDKIKNASILPAYARKTGMDEQELSDLMSAETWLSASEAEEYGFIDEITAEKKMAAHVDMKKYNFKNAPENVKPVSSADVNIQAEPVETPNIDKWNKHIAAR